MGRNKKNTISSCSSLNGTFFAILSSEFTIFFLWDSVLLRLSFRKKVFLTRFPRCYNPHSVTSKKSKNTFMLRKFSWKIQHSTGGNMNFRHHWSTASTVFLEKPLNGDDEEGNSLHCSHEKLIIFIINAFKRLWPFIKKRDFSFTLRIESPFLLFSAREERNFLTNESSLTQGNFSTFFYDLDLLRAIRSLRCHMSSSYSLVSVSSHRED